MKCIKCGNELKEGIKFCPQCGEEIKEEKKIRYCTKCGAEMQPDSSFCAKCGTGVNVAQEQGATKKPKKQGGKAKKIFLIAGIVIVVLLSIGGIMLNSEKAMYKAYVKFHEEYRDKHAQYEEYNDCAARIIMSPENEKWLAIYDITYVEYDKDEDDGEKHVESGEDKLTLYRYSWGKVKKVATFSKKTLADCEVVNFSVIDDELYLFADCYGDVSKKGNLKGAYHLNGNKFETVKVNEEKRKYRDLYKDVDADDIPDGIDLDEEYSVYTIGSGMYTTDEVLFIGSPCNYLDKYYDSWANLLHAGRYKNQLHIVNDIRFMNADEFTEVVEELSKYKIKNQIDLQISYGKILKEFGLFPVAEEYFENPLSSDYPVVGTIQGEWGKYFVRTSGNAEAWMLNNKNYYKALQSVDGRKVTRIEGISFLGEDLKIPEGITYIGKIYTSDSEKLKNVELPDSLKEIGDDAFHGCYGLKQIELPDSLEKIGDYAFSSNSLDQIEIPDSVKEIGEDAFGDSYGLLPVIIAKKGSYAQRYAEENDMAWSEKKLSEKEFEERQKIVNALDAYQAYINNYEAEYDGEEYGGVTLGYVNDDNIPECFVWRDFSYQSKEKGLTVLSYIDGELSVNTDFYAAYFIEDFTYTPKSGKICVSTWANMCGALYRVYELTDKVEVMAEICDFDALPEGKKEYTVNGEDYGSHEAIEEYISSLGLKDHFTEEDICKNISEAYDNLKKAN